MKKIALTGASGFVGGALSQYLSASCQFKLTSMRRQPITSADIIFDLTTRFNVEQALKNQHIDVLIHCAARAHILDDKAHDPLQEYRQINAEATIRLAKQSAAAGVKRFIFISTAKVCGESNEVGEPLSTEITEAPVDPYALSKFEAEQVLKQIAKETGMELVIIRPPLIYGGGVKANFASLMNLVAKGIPLPFGCITHNRRSLVSIGNLVDLIAVCIDHPKAANQLFLISDDHDVSTAAMVKQMSQALGKRNFMLPVPTWCYRLLGGLTGKQAVVDRLLGSLQVDISHTKQTLDWVPPQSLELGFKETAAVFLLNKEKNK